VSKILQFDKTQELPPVDEIYSDINTLILTNLSFEFCKKVYDDGVSE
jgi:hypothetical protein